MNLVASPTRSQLLCLTIHEISSWKNFCGIHQQAATEREFQTISGPCIRFHKRNTNEVLSHAGSPLCSNELSKLGRIEPSSSQVSKQVSLSTARGTQQQDVRLGVVLHLRGRRRKEEPPVACSPLLRALLFEPAARLGFESVLLAARVKSALTSA